jgi:hypothetical protein
MKSDDPEKDELIEAIIKKHKILKTYKPSEREELSKSTLEQLRVRNETLDLTVHIHSDPESQRIREAFRTGKMDPRWEPFVENLRQMAATKPEGNQRKILNAFIDHVTASDVLLQYIETMLRISYVKSFEQPDLEFFHTSMRPLFKQANLEYLLLRSPMAFTDSEGSGAKAILQFCTWLVLPPDTLSKLERKMAEKYRENSESVKSFLSGVERDAEIDSDKKPQEIAIPKMVNEIFGSRADFRDLSLIEYGEHFFKLLLS